MSYYRNDKNTTEYNNIMTDVDAKKKSTDPLENQESIVPDNVNPMNKFEKNTGKIIQQLLTAINEIKKTQQTETVEVRKYTDINQGTSGTLQSKYEPSSKATSVQNTNIPSYNQKLNSPINEEQLKPIKTLVEGLISDKEELNLKDIGIKKPLTINMKKPMPNEAILPTLYKELVNLLQHNKQDNTQDDKQPDKDDNSQSIEELLKYDIFYTLDGTIGQNKGAGTSDLHYDIYIDGMNKTNGPFVQCPENRENPIFYSFEVNQKYNTLKGNINILREPLINNLQQNQEIDYSNKKFQLCIKISNSETDIQQSSLMNMTIFN